MNSNSEVGLFFPLRSSAVAPDRSDRSNAPTYESCRCRYAVSDIPHFEFAPEF
jgi:hypothetical protein